MWSIHRVFHPFKVSDLGEMMSIMTKLTAKGTREVGSKVIIIFPLAFFIIAPMRVLVPWILVSPSELVLLRMFPSLPWIIILPFFSFLFGIIRLMGQVVHI
jgi:hypothetical protein